MRKLISQDHVQLPTTSDQTCLMSFPALDMEQLEGTEAPTAVSRSFVLAFGR